MAEFATRGVGNTALGLSIGALGVEALRGGMGGLFGGNGAGIAYATEAANTAMCLGDRFVTEKEMHYIQQLNEERFKNAILTSEQNTEIKIADVYERIMTKHNADMRAQEEWNTQQMINNTKMSDVIAGNKVRIKALEDSIDAITRTAIPESAICSFDGRNGCNGCGNNI